MIEHDLFDEEGSYLGSVELSGSPVVGDFLLVNSLSYYVVGRRWNTKGRLELILSDEYL